MTGVESGVGFCRAVLQNPKYRCVSDFCSHFGDRNDASTHGLLNVVSACSFKELKRTQLF